MNPCVLVVHHNNEILDLLGVRFEKAGFHPLLAQDGRNALDVAREHHPTLALVDMTSPRASTRELVDVLSGANEEPMRVCVIADWVNWGSLSSNKRVRCLTRGQVYHPAFTTRLMQQIGCGGDFVAEAL